MIFQEKVDCTLEEFLKRVAPKLLVFSRLLVIDMYCMSKPNTSADLIIEILFILLQNTCLVMELSSLDMCTNKELRKPKITWEHTMSMHLSQVDAAFQKVRVDD